MRPYARAPRAVRVIKQARGSKDEVNVSRHLVTIRIRKMCTNKSAKRPEKPNKIKISKAPPKTQQENRKCR
jgi:hypothetical protein